MMLYLKSAVVGLIQVVVLGAFLFIPAGTLDWPRAILLLFVRCVGVQIAIAVLAWRSPASLEARMQPMIDKSQPVADRFVTVLISLSLAGWLIFIPVDVFHLHIFPPPPLWLSACGGVMWLIGMGTVTAALYQNAFAAPIVKDQSERGQTLVDTGLYGYIRHPFYLGYLICFLGLGMWLESIASWPLFSVMIGLIVARTKIEENALRASLPGYAEYMNKVRYRIIPHVW